VPAPRWWVKIADFGVTKRAEHSATAFRTQIGTHGYMAPELFGFIEVASSASDTPSYTVAVDIWALGAITYRMVTNKSAFPTLGAMVQYTRNIEAFPREELERIEISAPCFRFIEETMAPDPEQRLTSAQCMEHPWIARSDLTLKSR
jgi:serine/threonine protein kinase